MNLHFFFWLNYIYNRGIISTLTSNLIIYILVILRNWAIRGNLRIMITNECTNKSLHVYYVCWHPRKNIAYDSQCFIILQHRPKLVFHYILFIALYYWPSKCRIPTYNNRLITVSRCQVMNFESQTYLLKSKQISTVRKR